MAAVVKEGDLAVTSLTYQLSDDQGEQIKDLFPPNGRGSGQWKDHCLMVDGILWALSAGGRWRNMPERFGPWQTVYDPFRKWCRNSLWERILRRLPARKMHRGEMDWQLFAIDGTGVRAHQSAAWAKEKTARPGTGGPRLGMKPRRFQHEAPPDR